MQEKEHHVLQHNILIAVNLSIILIINSSMLVKCNKLIPVPGVCPIIYTCRSPHSPWCGKCCGNAPWNLPVGKDIMSSYVQTMMYIFTFCITCMRICIWGVSAAKCVLFEQLENKMNVQTNSLAWGSYNFLTFSFLKSPWNNLVSSKCSGNSLQ